MDKNRHMENDRRKKRNKEEDQRHQITVDKGTTTDQIFDSEQGSKKKDESRQERIHRASRLKKPGERRIAR